MYVISRGEEHLVLARELGAEWAGTSPAEIPEKVEGIVKCVNPVCITNNEDILTRFELVSRQPVGLKCHYCEKITDQSNMEIITSF